MDNNQSINSTESFHMDSLVRIVKSSAFKEDLKKIERFIQSNYKKLHFQWGIKNKLKLAAERLVRFHIWHSYGLVSLYNTPLSSDVAFILDDCVMNIDCKTVDSAGNSHDRKSICFEPSQANFSNVPLNTCEIPEVPHLFFEGYEFHAQLAKAHNGLPVLSFFIFINYRDDGDNFSIEGTEICCLPHHQIVKEEFESNIIQGFKTYRYLKTLQAEKIDKNLLPRKEPKSNWIKVKIGRAKRYYDNKGAHPFDPDKLLIWGWESKQWNVCLGGHTTRVRKEKIKKRINANGIEWLGWRVIG